MENIQVKDLMKLSSSVKTGHEEAIVIKGGMRKTLKTDRIRRERFVAITSDRVRERSLMDLRTATARCVLRVGSGRRRLDSDGASPAPAITTMLKAFREGTFAKLGRVPKTGRGFMWDLIVKDDEAVVELHSLATAKNGMRFDNRYCWVVYFEEPD